MSSSTKIPWLKIIGWAILIHIILISISILEVLIYSLLINPDQEQLIYEQHAKLSAPYISIIFGILLFYFISRKLTKKRYSKRKLIGIIFPLVYIAVDFLILIASDINWSEQYLVFIISFSTKILASYIGATAFIKNND